MLPQGICTSFFSARDPPPSEILPAFTYITLSGLCLKVSSPETPLYHLI